MTSNSTTFALTSLVCGVVAWTSLAVAQSRQTIPQSASQLAPVQSNSTPRSELALPSERAPETAQARISTDAFERSDQPPRRTPTDETEAAKGGQLVPGE